MASALLALLAVGVAILAIIAIRRTPAAAAPAQSALVTPAPSAQAAPAPGDAAPANASAEAPATAPPTTPATTSTASPAAATPPAAKAAAATTSSPPAPATPAPARRIETIAATGAPHPRAADTTAPATKAAAAEPASGRVDVATPFVFNAKAVVVEGGKNREHDAKVLLSDGRVTVTEKNDQIVTVVPYGAVLGVSNSNSKQPLWNSPRGPAEVVKVEGGAFGFLKGGRNWVVLLTKDASVVLRVNDDEVGRVIAAIEDRTGRKVERVADRKD